MRGSRGIVVIGLLLALAALAVGGGCRNVSDDFSGSNIMQRTVLADQAETLSLPNGNTLHLPAGTFDRQTIVIFANFFTGADANPTRFPTPGKEASDILGAAVINTPVDRRLGQNITLTLDLLRPDAPRTGAFVANADYRIFRFDYETATWLPWGATTARANSAGTQATAVLPTDGFLGFVGSIAVFRGMLAGDVQPTVVQGTVRDTSGSGIATDVGVYITVGGERLPVAVTNGRVPALTDSRGQPFTEANTVDSGTDGRFVIEIPDSLIGQLISLEFGREDPARQTQTRFDVLAPFPSPVSNTTVMVVHYGENNVVSQPVRQ